MVITVVGGVGGDNSGRWGGCGVLLTTSLQARTGTRAVVNICIPLHICTVRQSDS